MNRLVNDVENVVDTCDSEVGLLRRWSKRKLQANKEAIENKEAANETATPLPVPDEETRTSQLNDTDMPAIESLDEDSDYSAFMLPTVSDHLRNLALRKLFHTNVFSIRDGLDDYDDDYTSFMNLGNVITADMRHLMKVETERKVEQALGDQKQNSLECHTQTRQCKVLPEENGRHESTDSEEA